MWGSTVHGLESHGSFLEVKSGGAVNFDEAQPHYIRCCLGGFAHDFGASGYPDSHLVRGQLCRDGFFF
jgi:hypothetical protein